MNDETEMLSKEEKAKAKLIQQYIQESNKLTLEIMRVMEDEKIQNVSPPTKKNKNRIVSEGQETKKNKKNKPI